MALETSSGRIRLRCDTADCESIFTPHSQKLVEGQQELLRDLAWLQGWRVFGGLVAGTGEPAPHDQCPKCRPIR
jgi:hypothetical protein